MDWQERGPQLQAGVMVMGVVLVLLGLWQTKQETETTPMVVIDDSATSSVDSSVMVDIAGAVQQPGVYKLDAGARVVDVLTLAGGFSEAADAQWVEQSLNQAGSVEDGQKIYIPFISSGEKKPEKVDVSNSAFTETQNQMDVNSANATELESLWGVGQQRAQAIINNRPYQSLEELAEKAGLPQNVIDSNRDKITFW